MDKINAFLDDPRLNEGIQKANSSKELLVFLAVFGLGMWLEKNKGPVLAAPEKD